MRPTRNWYEDNEGNRMDWPAQSPDFNPIENLKDKYFDNQQPSGADLTHVGSFEDKKQHNNFRNHLQKPITF
ncbi:hypothetical protein TNCV_1141911 [Trichonephila clavipes]|nr:hypothetical protein TNCV_1141911 [Trichonephila clavipes]